MIIVLTVLAASDHLAYGTVWFVSLIFPLPSARALGDLQKFFHGAKVLLGDPEALTVVSEQKVWFSVQRCTLYF